MLTTFLSCFCLFASGTVDVLRQHHLDTAEGRNAFLTEELAPYIEAAANLNQEITETSQQIQALSATEEKEDILALSQHVAQCMDLMAWMLPSLELVQHVDADLADIHSILSSQEPFTAEQQIIVDRLIALCQYIDQYKQE